MYEGVNEGGSCERGNGYHKSWEFIQLNGVNDSERSSCNVVLVGKLAT